MYLFTGSLRGEQQQQQIENKNTEEKNEFNTQTIKMAKQRGNRRKRRRRRKKVQWNKAWISPFIFYSMLHSNGNCLCLAEQLCTKCQKRKKRRRKNYFHLANTHETITRQWMEIKSVAHLRSCIGSKNSNARPGCREIKDQNKNLK